MSMANVSRAFSAALGAKGSSQGCYMNYVRGEDGQQVQRLTCRFTTPAGTQREAEGFYQGQADLVAAAAELGQSVEA